MLGPRTKLRLQAKAAETSRLLPLMEQLCTEYPSKLGPRGIFLRGACRRLLAVYTVMHDEPRMMTANGMDAFKENMRVFLTFWGKYGGHFYYNRHMAWHMAQRVEADGNPSYYHTYADESENRTMSRVAGTLHGGATFYSTCLSKVLL